MLRPAVDPYAPRCFASGQAFACQDHGAGQGSLGMPFWAGTYPIEARRSRYPHGTGVRRVLALAAGHSPMFTASRCGWW
jgi:hypothetical protein